MRRQHIQQALNAALAISNHHEFVIAGSLSVLGLLDQPPEFMSMSIVLIPKLNIVFDEVPLTST